MSKARFMWIMFGGAGLLWAGFTLGRSERSPAPNDQGNLVSAQDPIDPSSYDPNALVAKLATSRSPEEQTALLEALSRGTPAPVATQNGRRHSALREPSGRLPVGNAYADWVQSDPLRAHQAVGVRSPGLEIPDPAASIPGVPLR